MMVLITVLVLIVVGALVYLSFQIAKVNDAYEELRPFTDEEGLSGYLREVF